MACPVQAEAAAANGAASLKELQAKLEAAPTAAAIEEAKVGGWMGAWWVGGCLVGGPLLEHELVPEHQLEAAALVAAAAAVLGRWLGA